MTAGSAAILPDRPPRHLFVLGLLAVAVVHVAAARRPWAAIPLQTDGGMWSYMGWRMLAGDRLYTDLWETKPPGIYAVFAGLVAAGGPGSDRLAFWGDGLLSLAILATTYGLARRTASPIAAAAATCCAGVVVCHRVLADWGLNVEKFVALFEGLALLFIATGLSNGGRRAWLMAGVLTGFAGLFKQTALIMPVCVTVALLFGKPASSLGSRGGVARLATYWAGIALPWIPTLLWLGAQGSLGDFVRLAVLYDLQRPAAAEGSQLLSFTHWTSVFDHLRLAAMLLVPAALSGFLRRPAAAPSADRLIGWVLAIELLAYTLAPFGYGHYLLQTIPVAGYCAARLVDRLLSGPRVWALLAAPLALVCLLPLRDHLMFVLSDDYGPRIAYAIRGASDRVLAHRMADATRPDDDVVLWPPDAALSYYAGRRTPLQLSNADVLFKGKQYRLDPPFPRILEAARRAAPALVVDRTPFRIVTDETGAPALAIPANGLSLLAGPNPGHPAPEAALISEWQSWVREGYGGQELVAGAIFLHRERPWRDWQEFLAP